MISIQQLHFAYGKRKVFNGLSLQLQPGHIYGLLGKNGTGKSTLLRNVAGLLFPDDGRINVLNFDPSERQPAFLEKIFLVPEEFHLPNVKIDRFVKFNAPFYPNFSYGQFETYLKEFSIPMDNKLEQMSYGQKKKVLISFALACNTPVVLMDEPTNGLDIMSKSQFRKVMAGAVDENKCIVISTHQVKDLESLIDRITIIDEGSILFDQPIEKVSEKLQFKISFDQDELRQALYAEPSLKGTAVVVHNLDGEESRLDLELLYKAIVSNPKKVQDAFNGSL